MRAMRCTARAGSFSRSRPRRPLRRRGLPSRATLIFQVTMSFLANMASSVLPSVTPASAFRLRGSSASSSRSSPPSRSATAPVSGCRRCSASPARPPQSGGEVTVPSEVGHGSPFALYLPRVAPHLLPQRQAPNTAPAVAGSGMSVLLVEDNVELANFAADGLTELGYSITLIDNATDALAELVMDSDRFDVVFSDIVMPGMTGLDLAQAVRERGIGVPVVLTTGYSEALSQDGKVDFELVQKPYAIDQLSRVLHRLARRRVRDGAAE